MKKMIQVAVKEPQYCVSTNVTFAQVDGWFGHVVKDLKLDIVYPEHVEKRPCIVWICGGAWQQMSVSAHLAYLCELARHGFVVASVQYRTSNESVFPAQLEDIKAAIRYLKAHSDRFCIDPERFGIMGESAGAHLAAMAALTGDRKEYDKGDYLDYNSKVQAACPWYIPSDFNKFPKMSDVDRMASAESLLLGKNAGLHVEETMKMCPVSYVTKDAPPFLLLHGTDDHTVPFSQGEAMYEELVKHGVETDLIAIEGADHADLQFFQKEIWDLITEFFQRTLHV